VGEDFAITTAQCAPLAHTSEGKTCASIAEGENFVPPFSSCLKPTLAD